MPIPLVVRRRRTARLAVSSGAPVALLGAGLLVAEPASAHGIGGDAAGASVAEFVNIGAQHMLLGWDHILFVAGVLLLAGTPRRGAKIITAFVAGHSLTLITATLAGWQVDPVLVDVVIVLSVVVVGAWGMIGRPQRWDVFTAIVFAFGLVHGLGLATRFQALGVPEDGMLWRLITFNIGVELGQLMVILAVFTLATVVSTMLKGRYLTGLSKAAFFAMFGGGAILASLMAYWGFVEDDSKGLDVALPPGSQCVVDERSQPFPAAGGGHTEQTFFAPGEEIPMADL